MKYTDGFPQPLLTVGSTDYTNCEFSCSIVPEDIGKEFQLKIDYVLKSPGLRQMINDGSAEVIVIFECSKTSYRQMFEFENNKQSIDLIIKKSLIANNIILSTQIISAKDIDEFFLPEHDSAFFAGYKFKLRKGDILAIYDVELSLNDDEYEKSVLSIFQFNATDEQETISVQYDKNRIQINLSRQFNQLYSTVKNVPDFKRCASEMLIMPVLTEAIDLVRYGSENYSEYRWYNVVKKKLEQHGFDLDEISDPETTSSVCSVFLGNQLLGDIINEACKYLEAYDNNRSTEESEDD